MSDRKPSSHSTLVLWWHAFANPTVENYETIASDSHATLGRALGWLLVAGSIASIYNVAVFTLPVMNGATFIGSWVPAILQIFPGSLLGPAIAVVVGTLSIVLTFLLFSAIVHRIAIQFDGRGTFPEFLFTQSAHFAPITLLNGLLTFTSITAGLSIFVISYEIFLYAIALKAVHKIGWMPIAVIMVLYIMLAFLSGMIQQYFFGRTVL